MDAALLTPSKYIKAIEFRGVDRTLTITSIKLEKLEREDKTVEVKGIVTFAETAKGWVLNVTNVKCLIAMFGRETDTWIGKRVVLYPEPNEMSDSGFAIRVRGSLDIEKDVRFTLKLARKKPRQMTLKSFKKAAAANGAARSATGAVPTSAPQGPASSGQPSGDAFPDVEPPEQTDDDPSLAALDPA